MAGQITEYPPSSSGSRITVNFMHANDNRTLPTAAVDGDDVLGPAVGGAGGEPGGLDDAAGGVGLDGFVRELADGEEGADGFEARHVDMTDL